MESSAFYQDREVYLKGFSKALLKCFIQWAYLVGLAGPTFSYSSYWDGSTFTVGGLLAAGLMSLVVAFFVLPLTLKECKNQVKTSAGEEDRVSVRFYEDCLEIHQGQNRTGTDCKNIERIFTSQGPYIFQMGKNSGFYLPKGALTPEKEQVSQALLQDPFNNLSRKSRGLFSSR